MSVAPPTLCTHGNCRKRATAQSRCADHQRPSARARGYVTGWAPYAKRWLAMFPWCGMRQDGRMYSEHSGCARRGLFTRARVVDHIRSIAAGGAVFDPANHQSLCYSCNTRKG